MTNTGKDRLVLVYVLKEQLAWEQPVLAQIALVQPVLSQNQPQLVQVEPELRLVLEQKLVFQVCLLYLKLQFFVCKA